MMEVPVVIISALRPAYLEQVMVSLSQQHPNTPAWIAKSPRYLFVHRHERNDLGSAYTDVQVLASKYNWTLHEFQGLHSPKAKMNVNANRAWYRMMSFLFRHLYAEEAIMVEDDAVLAPDALMVAAKLLQEKRLRHDVHAISLGGCSGDNKINPDPRTYLALRPRFFHAMAYSMNATLFQSLAEQKNTTTKPLVPDWTEERIHHQQYDPASHYAIPFRRPHETYRSLWYGTGWRHR